MANTTIRDGSNCYCFSGYDYVITTDICFCKKSDTETKKKIEQKRRNKED